MAGYFWRPRSLASRQLLASAVGLIAFLAVVGLALDRAFIDTAERNLRDRLVNYALAYTAGTEFDIDGYLIPPYRAPDPRLDRPGSGLYAQLSVPSGHWHSTSAEGPALPEGQMLQEGEERFEGPLPMRNINGSPGEVYRYSRSFIAPGARGDDIGYTIHVLEDTRLLDAQINVFRSALWTYLGVAAIFLLVLQMLTLRWSLRPLRHVIAELDRVKLGKALRMSEHHPRELAPLTDSINALIESERTHLERQRNTLADLAHSLKTPLAVLRARLDSDAGEAELREELNTQLEKMNSLVSYQLSRAASGGHKLFSTPVEILPQAEQIVVGLEKIYAAKGVLCEFELDETACFHGELGDLQELLGNLLENAFKWAKSRVLLTVAKDGKGVMLAVDDDGPGIPAEKIEKVLQRGVRGDERVQGHGIGLSIVQDIIHGYGGQLQVGASQELGGARFEVKLPGQR
ncbi:two-component sensor histidine kinase [Lysobacteraceae bacterium NML75-0749]|nr:two-component sensor histidine kinase [Xanthomonadaceae bacterium NML75-0749]PJK04943.1 two-component sensor histidine kinase [Xanthomonadaceae bacterium NML91-0268]